MKLRFSEDKIILIITSLLALYDIIYLPYKTLLTTLVFAFVIYMLTNEMFFVALVLLVPNFILLINKLFGNKEKFTTIKEISDRIKSIKKEPFVGALEVAERVNDIKKGKYSNMERDQPKNEVADLSNLEKLPSFMNEDVGIDVNENTRIKTDVENSVPKIGTTDKNPIENPIISNYDSESINIALSKTTNNNAINPGNLNSIDV